MTQKEIAEHFRALHTRDQAFVIPNAWDIGSARLLAVLGFEALATTSSGYAQSLGRVDGMVSLDETLTHCRTLCEAVDVPVSADLENCFADEPEAVAETITRAAETGLAGGSIEDYSGDPANPIYDFTLAVERVQAAVEAARSLELPFTLTARAENLLRGVGDLDETIRRLQAFEAAGADVLYAPNLKTLDEVRAVTGAVQKPVNVLAPPLRAFSLVQLSAAGVRRVSTGGALARAAMGTVMHAATAMRDHGSFEWCADLPAAEIDRLLKRPPR